MWRLSIEIFNNNSSFFPQMNLTAIKQKILTLDQEKRIRFIFLFGSVAEHTKTPLSDIDIAIYYDDSPTQRFQFRKTVLGSLPDKADVQIFQDLPLAVRKEVLQGKVMYADEQEFMISECIKVVREFSSFEKYYNIYVDALKAEAAA